MLLVPLVVNRYEGLGCSSRSDRAGRAAQKKTVGGRIMSLTAIKYPALNVSAATAELVKGVLALYPQAQIVPRVAPLEDEEISVEVRLPVGMEEIYQARDQIHELVIQLQEQYDVLILASAVPA
jgi:hypothetical protein